jgi:hypothetical protein
MLIATITITIIGMIVFYLPIRTMTVRHRLEKDGYRHITIKKISVYHWEARANHINLTQRTIIKVEASLGHTAIEII